MEFELPISLLNWILAGALAALSGAVGIGVKAGIAYIRLKTQGALFDMIRKWAYTYVAALQQDPTLKGLASEEKKERAMLWLVAKAEVLGITLTEGEASNLIEEAVYFVKEVVLDATVDALE
jgi:hypothetical protein